MMDICLIVPQLAGKLVVLILIFGLLVCMRAAPSVATDECISYKCSDGDILSCQCQDKDTYSTGSGFEANLNYTLFTEFPDKASLHKFSNYSKGTGEDQVYALYYCSGNVDFEDCHDCVQAAAKLQKITSQCHSSKEGIFWFQECTLRYANRNIFSLYEETSDEKYLYYNKSAILNENNLNPYQKTFDSTMDAVIHEAAYSKGILPGFATNEANLSSSETLRGLAQCSSDISGDPCFRCLTAALGKRDTWENTIVFLPSCFLRFDLFGSETVPPPSQPTRPSRRVLYIAILVVVPVVLVVLAVIGCPRLWRRCSKGVPDENGQNHDNPPDGQPRSGEDRVHGLPRYTFSQVKQMTKKFEKQLGKGGYGVVYLGVLLDGSNRKVAVKVLSEADAPKQFSNEINVFVRISHNNLVSLLGYCEDGTNLALVYEYMDMGDLRAHLSDNAGSLSWTARLNIAIGTAEGLQYLHNHGKDHIVHRDVKPANILLKLVNGELQAKVADFGLSKIFPEADVTTLQTRVVVSHGYTAPEYNTTGLLNAKADVYSFGVVLLELITGIAPRRRFNLVEDFEKLYETANLESILDRRLPKDLNNSSVWGVTELARSCVKTDEKERPDMWKVVVRLKECLSMEIHKNAGSSSKGYTSMEMIGAVLSDSITKGPEAR